MDISNVLYFGIELDESSRDILLKILKDKKLPETWNPRIVCHHMTVAFKSQFMYNPDIVKWCVENLGKQIRMVGMEIGISDKAIALRVGTDAPSCNKLKHITIAVNKNTGGKPVDSNFIETWEGCPTVIVGGTLKAF